MPRAADGTSRLRASVPFGSQLRDMRVSLGLSLDRLSDDAKLYVDKALISRWEKGEQATTLEHLLMLVRYFAGKVGGLGSPAEAQTWAALAGAILTRDELAAAFKDASPAQISEAILAPRPSPTRVLANQERKQYLYLLTKAYGRWEAIYVPQEADELRGSDAPRLGKVRRPYDAALRSYEHVYEQMGLERRERLHTSLLDWFLDEAGAQRHDLALLAVPGCGKSTALEEMAGELARRQLQTRSEEDRLPVLISLGDYGEAESSLREWLPEGARQALTRALAAWSPLDRTQAEKEAADDVRGAFLPLVEHLERLRQAGKLILLVDGLNELPGGAGGRLRPAVEEFVASSVGWNNRVAVACRRADYSNVIADLNRVELLPFDEERIYQAVWGHLADEGRESEAAEVIAALREPRNARLREILAIPLYVEVFSKSLARQGDLSLPANRGELLDGFARALLVRELEREDTRAQRGRAWISLPEPLALHSALAEMAYAMRDRLDSRGSTHDLSKVRPLLAAALLGQAADPDEHLNLAAGAGLLTIDREARKIGFWKEPIEEVFAARHLLALYADDYCSECEALWRVPLVRGHPALADNRSWGDPPAYPNSESAWEETTILAAGLAGRAEPPVSPDAFVLAVLAANPGLAGRCLLEGGAEVSAEVRERVQSALLALMQDQTYSVRARIPCGVLLGRLGDPRFHDEELLCLPREPLLGFVRVPAGPFRMGSDRATVDGWNRQAQAEGYSEGLYDDELGADREQALPHDYLMARYPVTNAQFRCFVADGGYGLRWRRHLWTEAGLRWLDGERWSDALDQVWRRAYDVFRKRGEATGYSDYEDYRDRVVRPYLARLRKDDLGGDYWADPENNAPNQPVMGVTWHEAAAYAGWLGARLVEAPGCPGELRDLLAGRWAVRLPSEPEWEKAARGGLQMPGADGQPVRNPLPGRQWPWANEWDANLCNSAGGDEPVRWLSPVGAYPGGASPYGCLDMVGNVWEWTRSLYEPYPYPSAGKLLRQREDPEREGLPVVRGGSWDARRGGARCAVRRGAVRVSSYDLVGLRVVVSLSDPGS